MTIDKAVERTETELHDNPTLDDPGLRQAMFLGVEALKLISWIRQGGIPASDFRLPSETID